MNGRFDPTAGTVGHILSALPGLRTRSESQPVVIPSLPEPRSGDRLWPMAPAMG